MYISVEMLRNNFITFDWSIAALFAVNIAIFVIIAVSITKGKEDIYQSKTIIKLYKFYENITSLFPLLGIFGTVISLMSMVSEEQIMISAFSSALTSTFWGLVAAMLCKAIDGFISAGFDYPDNGNDNPKGDKSNAQTKHRH